MNQKYFKVILTYNQDHKETAIWAKSLEEARNKVYFKFRNADNREVFETN